MLSLTKICILIAILLIAMEGKGENVKTPNEDQDIQMMEEEKEATGDSVDEMEENVEDEAEKENNLEDEAVNPEEEEDEAVNPEEEEDEAVNPEEESDNNPEDNDVEDELVIIRKNCNCDDKVNKALINSLATCSQTLSTIENCKVGKVSSIGTSKEHVVPCTCNKALTAHLVKSLKSCTQAVETLTKCKKGGEGGKGGGGGGGGGGGKGGGGEEGEGGKGGGGTPPTSCDELRKNDPTLKSGNYKLHIGGKVVPVYCHMGKLCGTVGGWTRLGYFHAHRRCPNGQFRRITKRGLRLCRINSNRAGCATASYSSHGIKYSTICGYAKGYQKGQVRAFVKRGSIYSNYVDGVSFQRFDVSTKKRKHVWSYACGWSEKARNVFACPCNKGARKGVKPPSFVGNNYYCESGTSKRPTRAGFYRRDPLWDGQRFNNHERPCRKDMMPYFKRTYGSAITDYIIVKLCRTYPQRFRDVYLQRYGIFVK